MNLLLLLLQDITPKTVDLKPNSLELPDLALWIMGIETLVIFLMSGYIVRVLWKKKEDTDEARIVREREFAEEYKEVCDKNNEALKDVALSNKEAVLSYRQLTEAVKKNSDFTEILIKATTKQQGI